MGNDVSEETLHPIRRWLIRHGHSQTWLAKQVGVKRAAVSKWVNGRANPSPETAFQIAELSDGELSVEQLINPRNVSQTWAPRLTKAQQDIVRAIL